MYYTKNDSNSFECSVFVAFNFGYLAKDFSCGLLKCLSDGFVLTIYKFMRYH